MKNAFRRITLIIFALLIGYYIAVPIQALYCSKLATCTGGFFGFDFGILLWMMFPYGFVVTVLYAICGEKYWWAGIVLLPVVVIEIIIDPLHIYIPIIFGLIGWLLGTLTNKALWKLTPGFMSRITA
jgi:hypothetical protein